MFSHFAYSVYREEFKGLICMEKTRINSQLAMWIEVNAAHLSPLDSMATAENLGREKHHFNLVKITTIPSVTAKPFSEV